MQNDTRRRILDAALAMVSESGVRATTLEDISVRAKVSRQTVYRYFGSKEGLVQALVLREEEGFLDQVLAALEDVDGLQERLSVAISTALRAARAHPLLDRIMATEPEALLPYLTTSSGPVLSILNPVLARLLGEDEHGASPEQLELLSDVYARLLISYAINPGDVQVDDLARELSRHLVASLDVTTRSR